VELREELVVYKGLAVEVVAVRLKLIPLTLSRGPELLVLLLAAGAVVGAVTRVTQVEAGIRVTLAHLPRLTVKL
jgi:hypothetical protein